MSSFLRRSLRTTISETSSSIITNTRSLSIKPDNNNSITLNIHSRIAEPNDKPTLIVLASIGNPESQYKGTRHSVGHYILNKFIERNGFNSVNSIDKFKFSTNSQKSNIICFQTPGYMNLSGKNLIKPWTAILKLKSKDYNPVLVVLHDELDLELGKVKVRKQNSSHRGHNGLRSIQEYIGKGYNAVQLGIGRYYDGDRKQTPGIVADYVLSQFKRNEFKELDDSVVESFEEIVESMENGKYIFEKQK